MEAVTAEDGTASEQGTANTLTLFALSVGTDGNEFARKNTSVCTPCFRPGKQRGATSVEKRDKENRMLKHLTSHHLPQWQITRKQASICCELLFLDVNDKIQRLSPHSHRAV